eukprot:g67846.t1
MLVGNQVNWVPDPHYFEDEPAHGVVPEESIPPPLPPMQDEWRTWHVGDSMGSLDGAEVNRGPGRKNTFTQADLLAVGWDECILKVSSRIPCWGGEKYTITI